VMHRRVGKVVALNAVLDEKARAAGSALGKLVQLERGRKNALEYLTVRAFSPALFCLFDELRGILGGGGRRKEQGGDGQYGGEVHAAIILGHIPSPA
jgi:hypothetical protein